MHRENLLTAVRDVRVTRSCTQLTALGTRKMREAMQGTNNLRTTGTAHLLVPPGGRRPLPHPVDRARVRLPGSRTARDHEDDPFAEPAPGQFGSAIAAMRSTEEQVFSADEIEGIALRYGFSRPGQLHPDDHQPGAQVPAAGALVRGGFITSSTWRTPPPRPWPPWRRGAPDRRTTSSTTSRCVGPIT
jgi:hypothetical protein